MQIWGQRKVFLLLKSGHLRSLAIMSKFVISVVIVRPVTYRVGNVTVRATPLDHTLGHFKENDIENQV